MRKKLESKIELFLWLMAFGGSILGSLWYVITKSSNPIES